MDTTSLIKLGYLISAVFFILGLKNMTHPRTAVRGNLLGAFGMLLAVLLALLGDKLYGGSRDPLGRGRFYLHHATLQGWPSGPLPELPIPGDWP